MNEMELRDIVISYLKESKKALGLVEIINILLIKNLISLKDKDVLQIKQLREICIDLVNEGSLIEKTPGKFAYREDYKGEIKVRAIIRKELKDVIIEYLKDSRKTLSFVEILNILLIKNLVSDKDKANLNIGKVKEICEDLKNNGIFIEKSPGKFAYNFEAKEEPAKKIEPKPVPSQATPVPELPAKTIEPKPIPSQAAPGRRGTNLDLMWEYAENKTNKKLAVDGVFNYFAEEKQKGELEKIILDFMDYFKIEKNKENIDTWEQNFGNALIVQGIITKWD